MASPEKVKERPTSIRAWLKRWWPVLLTMYAIVVTGILVWSWWQWIISITGIPMRIIILIIIFGMGSFFGLPLAVWLSITTFKKNKRTQFWAFFERWVPAATLIFFLSLIGMGWFWWDEIVYWAQSTGGVDGKPSDVSQGEILRNIAWALGGAAAVLIGLPLAIWRGIVARKEARTSARNLNNERYQKGAEMLGSDMLATRIGGVYALERLADERPGAYYAGTARLLCSLIQNSKEQDSSKSSAAGSKAVCSDDVKEAMRVIGRRSERQLEIEHGEDFRLNLMSCNLVGVALRNPNLSYIAFDKTDFSRSFLLGATFVNTDLLKVDFSKANLSSADFTGALNLTQAQLKKAVIWEGDKPPIFGGAKDPKTKKLLVWKGKSVPLPSGVSTTHEYKENQ